MTTTNDGGGLVATEDGTITQGALEFTARAMLARPSVALTFDNWNAAGAYLDTVHGAVQWWLGDWLVLGEQRFGEEHSQGLAGITVNPDTLSQYAWVARNIPPSRRVYGLPWSVYREVADLSPADQQRWLARAEAGTDGVRWTAAQLARAMKEERVEPGTPELWVLAKCTDRPDQERLMERLRRQGREVKPVEKGA